MKRCRDCASFKKEVPNAPQNAGECHLNPPTVISGPQAPMACWPIVNDEDFCGSFEPSTECSMGNERAREHPEIRGGRITRPVDVLQRPSVEADKVVDEVDMSDAKHLRQHPTGNEMR